MVMLLHSEVPSEGVRCTECNTEAYVNGKELGSGSLYITESAVTWINSERLGFSLDYPSISLHAVSTDLNAFPKEHLYLMVEGTLGDDEIKEESSESGEDGDTSSKHEISEVRFAPGDKTKLSDMYQSMCDCQELHPDPNDSPAEEDFYDGEEDEVQLSANGLAVLNRLEGADAGDSFDTDEPQIGHSNGVNAAGDANEAMETGQFDDAD